MKLCTDCGQRESSARGLCGRCYRRAECDGRLDDYPRLPVTTNAQRAAEAREESLRRWVADGKPRTLRRCAGCREWYYPRHVHTPKQWRQAHCSRPCQFHRHAAKRAQREAA